jgi:hypothetical protein
MKYVVTALFTVVCVAGLCRWLAGRIADRRHRGPGYDRRSGARYHERVEQQRDRRADGRSNHADEPQPSLLGPGPRLAPERLRSSQTNSGTDLLSH